MSQLEKSAKERREEQKRSLRARLEEADRDAAAALGYTDFMMALAAAGATEAQLQAIENVLAKEYDPNRAYTLEELQKLTDEMNAAMRHANTLGRR